MWLRTLLVAILLAATGLAARAEEYVKSFRSDIEIAPTGKLTVIETITIVSEGKEFKHGIFRDFPMGYMTSDGMTPVTLDIIEVTRDGVRESHHPGFLAGGRRVYFGKKDVLLPDGEHTYRITYRTDNRTRPAGENDMLPWNVTGTWPLRIEHAEARVKLPNGTKVLSTQATAGTPEMSYDNASVTVEGSTLVFRSVLPVQPRGSLQFTILIPKDFIERPH
jgi:hypothetical protein